MGTIYKLPAGHTITAAINHQGGHIRQVQDPTIGAVITSSHAFGPYSLERDFIVGGDATVTIAEASSIEPNVIGDDVRLLSGAGAPEDAVQATLSCNPTGDDNALTFTAVAYGASGNSITIAYVDPEANDAALSVVVASKAITVNLATDSGGVITSTAADVLAAIEASANASDLVTVEIDAGDSGTGDDGSGVVTALAAAPMTGGEGTGIGTAGIGSIYVNETDGVPYRNSGTKAAPVWTALADAA